MNQIFYVPNFWGERDNLTIIENNAIMCFQKFTAAVISVQVCDEIQNPGQKSFKLNYSPFVDFLKITAVETWIIQGTQGNFTMTNASLRERNLTPI